MSFAQNLAYSGIQAVHNFGAVAIVGGSLAALRLRESGSRRKLAKLVVGGWIAQAISGAAFGAVSYYFFGDFPDISGIAGDALATKIACAVSGFLLLIVYLFKHPNWPATRLDHAWIASTLLAVTAITAAAVLRWFA